MSTSRNYTRENRETSPVYGAYQPPDRHGKPKAQSVHERRGGVEHRHSTCEVAEQSRKTLAAEVAEGRPVTEENNMEADTYPTQCGVRNG